MKLLILKLSLLTGMSVTGIGFCQTALQNELILPTDQSSTRFVSDVTVDSNKLNENIVINDNKEALGSNSLKTYGAASGTYSVVLAASSATPISTNTIAVSDGQGCIYTGAGSIGGSYDLPLQMPDGHQILGMRYAYVDSSTSGSSATLYSVDINGVYKSEHIVYSDGDSGYGSEYETLSPNYITVNNEIYKYVIRFVSNTSGTDQQACAIRMEMDSTP